MKKIIVGIVILISLLLVLLLVQNNVRIKDYSNDYFEVSYDSTWKVENKNNVLELKHKKTDSKLEIQYKELDNNLIDVSLSELINDIIASVEKQNSEYDLINVEELVNDDVDGYSYLYENDKEQALVNVYKKDSVLVIVYYAAKSEVYDIVLDSVDSILDSLVIKSGEK